MRSRRIGAPVGRWLGSCRVLRRSISRRRGWTCGLGEARDAVLASTSQRQEPFAYGSLGGRTISIVDAPASSSASPAPSVADPAAQAWAAVKDANSIAALEAFIRRFGDSFYADWARLRIDEIVPLVGEDRWSCRPLQPALARA